jgi:uncharacterized membrane protein
LTEQASDSIVVLGNLSDVYNIWANFESFPHFMQNVKSVVRSGERTSDWLLEGPMGTRYEWQADIIALEENRRVAWRSRPGGDLILDGEATFEALGPNETRVSVNMRFGASDSGSPASQVINALFRNPEGRLREDLQRFKSYVESTADRLRESTE